MNREIKLKAVYNNKIYNIETICFEDEIIYIFEESIYSGKRQRLKLSEVIIIQYTGLKDKNGKEIYEGDVLKIEFRKPTQGKGQYFINGSVQWDNKLSGFLIYYYDEDTANIETRFINNFGNELDEIIGNIYENPNLIK